MNLHGVVSRAIGAVNPFIEAQFQRCTGYTTAPDGGRIPSYSAPETASVQKQELTFKDLQHIDGMNLQTEVTAIWFNGSLKAADRVGQTGGDLVLINGQTWLVVAVPETWPDWCHAVLCLQVDS